MLLCLGLFVFSVHTAPLQTLQRQSAWRWPHHGRIDHQPAYQFVGRGEDTLQLSGMLAPEITGGPSQLALLRTMAEKGEPYLLIQGTGEILGYWLIEAIADQQSALLANGQALKIQFDLTLKRYSGRSTDISPLTPLLPLLTRLF